MARSRKNEVHQKSYARLGMIGSIGQGKAMLNAAIGKVMAEHNPVTEPGGLKPYVASLRKSGRQVGVYAQNGDEARNLLEQRHGKGTVFLIHRIEDPDDTPRGND